MTTLRIRSLVSLVATLIVALTLGACASSPSRLAADEAVQPGIEPLTFRFDNDARDYVHVYLVGVRREWLLGRVEPGARATLRIPEEALAQDLGSLRLAVLAGQRVTLRAAGEPRAATSIIQPAAELVALRWTFTQTPTSWQLTPHTILRPHAAAGPQ